MAKRQTVTIGEFTFQTKAECKEFVKTILNKYQINTPVDKPDLEFISELLKRHPEYETKVGSGIKEIVIKLDGYWVKTRCFYIVRTDGTYTDFSYGNCIDNDTSREPFKMFNQSARSAVKDQIISHLSTYIKRTKDANEKVVCQKSQIKIHR